MKTHTFVIGTILAVSLTTATHATILVTATGDGTGYDLTGPGTATNEIGAWRSTDVAKTFDLDGDNIYGTAGFIFAGDGGPIGNNQALTRVAESTPSWATITTAAGTAPDGSGLDGNISGLAVNANANFFDDPNVPTGPGVADWDTQGFFTVFNDGANSVAGDWHTAFQIDLLAGTPNTIRLGVFGGNESTGDNRWDATGYRVSSDGGATWTEITGLPGNGGTALNAVFFDVDLNGEDTGSLLIAGQQRIDNRDFTSIAGITIDAIPEPSSSALLGLGVLGFLARRRR